MPKGGMKAYYESVLSNKVDKIGGLAVESPDVSKISVPQEEHRSSENSNPFDSSRNA